MSSAQAKWDRIYRAKIASGDLTIFEIEANLALISAARLLPKKGRALDLAAGLAAGLSGIATGWSTAICGDLGVRAVCHQPKYFASGLPPQPVLRVEHPWISFSDGQGWPL